jgi:uncharacterized iron-regulated protein
MRSALVCALLLSLQATPSQPSPSQPPRAAAAASYVPQRVYDTHQRAFTDFETMLADLGRSDVVFLGEEHDDPNTHRLELAVLEGLTRRRIAIEFALEMFERDVQAAIDRYVSGASTEDQFLGAARPWPRYATDYRPSVEFARAHQLPIVASNVPRRIATDVAKIGLSALDRLADDRRLAAADLLCEGTGEHYERFQKMMAEHPGSADPGAPDVRVRNDRFYLAQCVKDETMGESIAAAFEKTAARPSAVVHVNGAFHSDFGTGAAESARRRLPGRRIVIVSIVPIADIDAAHPDADDLKRADYLVYTIK